MTATCSSSPSSAKPRPSRKHKSSKENDPPSDPNLMVPSSPSQTKLKSKRKLTVDTLADNSLPAISDSGVQVIVRIRPLCSDKDEGVSIVQKISNDSLSINGQTFTFDSVADVEATQLDIFEHVGVPLVENCLAGFNSSVFAYGQTGSGKTYTMWGPANSLSEENVTKDQQGLTPRVFERLFAHINEEQTKHSDRQLNYQCRCSFLELYNEQISDLLDPNQTNLQIREDVKSGVYVENLTEEQVSTMKDVTQILLKGLSNKRIGATSINSESSRSHAVFTCVVESRCRGAADGMSRIKISRINLVDLAGSERQKLTGADGEHLKEAGNINRSLSQLGNLINILAEISQTGACRHLPYRDSRLTFLLQESLGGNAKLAMVCAISPAQSCRSETFSTLRFAQCAKAIKNKAVVNEVMQDDVNHLRQVIRQLRDELHRAKANGHNPMESSGGHSAAWVRRSLNILQSSLNRPPSLSRVDEDGDEEMEIDEQGVEDHDDVFCNVNMPNNCNVVSENDNAMNTDDQDSAQPSEEKNNPSLSGSKCPNEESSRGTVRTSFSCPVGESDIGDLTGFSAPDASVDSPHATTNCVSPAGLSIVKCDLSPILQSPTPCVSPRINTSRKNLRTSSGISPSENDLNAEELRCPSSRWISPSEELRAEPEANRSLAEKRKQELDAERKCAEELWEAMHTAIESHARVLEQYADLEEKHIKLLARHRKIQNGIEDVKKAASRAGVRGAESKFINALAAEISALKAEREKERRILRDENRGLQAQLKDTAEAVQAAGELLFRLKEAEEAVTNAQKRATDAEQEAAKAYKQIDKLKKKHQKEIITLNELLEEARLQKGSVTTDL